MAGRVWARRFQLQSRFGASWPWIIALVLASWAGIVAGLLAERELLLWLSVTASTAVQALLVVPAFLRARRVNELGLAGTCPSGGADAASGCRAVPDGGP